ncbi:hypothetical protein AYI70_g9561, partial [Smittium culicis]
MNKILGFGHALAMSNTELTKADDKKAISDLRGLKLGILTLESIDTDNIVRHRKYDLVKYLIKDNNLAIRDRKL